MSSRIGALHVRYRSRGSGLATAMAPHVDRLLASRLGDAIDERLTRALGETTEVVVIRDLKTRVTLARSDWSLDSRVLDQMGRASVDAIAAAIAGPSTTDDVVRFADQAEFVGSFIIDLLGGSAWDRWYYGAFARYHSGDAAGIIAAVLEDNREHVA